jgi:hypothetical protein
MASSFGKVAVQVKSGFAARCVTRGVVLAGCAMVAVGMQAQTPVVLPNTISTLAGSSAVATTANTACPTNAQFTAQDGNGNGCPAVNATFAGNEKGLTVDPQGNVYVVADTSNPQSVRRIDARTGNISLFAGLGGSGSLCGTPVTVDGTTYTQTDKTGDGCPVQYSGGFNAARGLGSDPYGNIIIGVTGDYALHFVCTAVSPMCTAAQVQVNLMRNIAGCTPTASSYGTAVTGTTVGTAGDGTLATQFSGTCAVGINQVRSSVGDKWDNIFFMDDKNGRIRVVAGAASITVNGVVVANPLYAVLATSTGTGTNYASPQMGYIYPIAGGGTVCGAATDTVGDGCPFYQTTVNTSNSGATVQGVAVDKEGDFIFDDANGNLRVIYAGGVVIKGALAANGVSSPQIGYSYRLAGGGSTVGLYYNAGAATGIYLGNTVTLQNNAYQLLATDPAGNVYIGDQTQVLFYDIATGYIRRIGGGSGTTSCNSSAIGDGCPITQASFNAANGYTPIAIDGIGNLYIEDVANKRIRLVSATTLPATAVHATQASNLVVHAPTSGSSVVVSTGTSPDFAAGAPACVTNTSADGSVDCTVPVTFAPKSLGQRSLPVTVATTVASTTATQNFAISGTAAGSALVFDTAGTPMTSTLGSATTGNTTIVLDGAGNQYVSGTQGISKITSGVVKTISSTPAAYLAVDAAGNVYAASASATTVTEYVNSNGTYTSTTINIPMVPINGVLTQGHSGPLAVDADGVIYIADLLSKQVIKFTQTTGVGTQLTQTALGAPVAMTQDAYGNLLVVDGTSVVKVPSNGFTINASSPVTNTAITFSPALAAPTSIAVDQGENLYVADSGNVILHSLSGYQYTIPVVTGSGVAVDGVGNLYATASTVPGVTELLRSAESTNFGTNVSTAYVGVFVNAGPTASTGFAQTDTGGNYSALAPATPLAATGPACSNNLAATPLAGGALCNTSLQFAPTATGSGDTPDVITFLPSATTVGSLSLDGLKNGSTATTMTTLSGTTTGLVYSTGVETTFTVQVQQSTGTPAGVVTVSVDGGTAVSYPLTASTTNAAIATATVPVSGLAATTVSGMAHTISANYAGSSGIAGSSSGPTSFMIGQAMTTAAWTPATTTQQYSAAIGAGVLNATASSTAATGNVPGYFLYSATPSGGIAQPIHSASYLPIGTYTLSATFVPNDAVDYVGTTGSVASYTVTKASTTAGLGASQMVVASDGTGNFTNVQAAINALGATGGSVYVKPGTYTGDITVVQPNVAIRGLGGDPTKVVLTHASGSFSNNPGSVYNYAGEFNTSFSNGFQLPSGSSLFSGDEGSATMVIAKGVNTAFSTATLTPNNFYGENFSLINTYDSDTMTTTTTYVSGGVCMANAGAAQSYSALYNAGTECASQALAVWITSDLAVMNNVYTTSLQDTIYAGSQGSGSSGYVPSREYWFRGKVTGDVDYIFGDAAAVFDSSTIYSAFHGTSATGTVTIEAQNKAQQTGGGSDYLSGYVMNNNVFTSQAPGMTSFYFGRPYGTYSTWAMLNSYVDQVTPAGYIEFSGDTNLPTSTYVEYNDIQYTDPTTGGVDINGVTYIGAGGNTGAGVTGTRETVSQDPGTLEAGNSVKTTLTAAQAQQYFPTNFLSQSVPSAISSTTNWNPTAALAADVNAFAGTGSAATVTAGASVTVLMRPQTPGLGAIVPTSYNAASPTQVVWTIPSGTYTLSDTLNGNTTTLASGSLDAAGEAYFTTTSLAAGTHNLTWTYSGDANFTGSTSSMYAVTVNAIATTTALQVTSPIVYGQSASVTAMVSSAAGTPGGVVTLTIDGGATQTGTLNGSGQYVFTVAGLTGGSHSFTASYGGGGTYGSSATTSAAGLTVQPASVTVTASCASRLFDQVNVCSAVVGTLQYSDSVATVFVSTPTGTTTALRNSVAGPYVATPVYTLSSFGTQNYTVNAVNGNFTVTGGVPQTILFQALPNFVAGGSYQLTAHTTSGLPVSYSITSTGGNASISGHTLIVTAPGLVTIQATTSADPTGDYAAATPVSRSFTAQ